MVLLQLCPWKFSHKENLWQTSFHWTWILFTKTINSLFEPPFGGVRGNVHTSSVAHWKACGWLPIHDNWTFFACSYGWEFAFFKGMGWVSLSTHFRWKGTSPINLCWCQKLEWLHFHVVSNYRQYVFPFVTMHVCDRNTVLWSARSR